jgi:EthD domain
MASMIKRLTFVRRAGGVEPDEFAERWRVAALATDTTSLDRLVHCVVRPGRTDRPYHGVAIEWFPDESALTAHDASAGGDRDDVIDVASRLQVRVDTRIVLGPDELTRWWATGESRLVVLGVIQRAAALTREQFAAYWWDDHRPLANRLLPPEVQPDAYVHDYVLPGEPAPFDGVGEFYDPSAERTRERTQWAERPGAPETALITAEEERFLVRDTRWALLTDATVVLPPPDLR